MFGLCGNQDSNRHSERPWQRVSNPVLSNFHPMQDMHAHRHLANPRTSNLVQTSYRQAGNNRMRSIQDSKIGHFLEIDHPQTLSQLTPCSQNTGTGSYFSGPPAHQNSSLSHQHDSSQGSSFASKVSKGSRGRVQNGSSKRKGIQKNTKPDRAQVQHQHRGIAIPRPASRSPIPAFLQASDASKMLLRLQMGNTAAPIASSSRFSVAGHQGSLESSQSSHETSVASPGSIGTFGTKRHTPIKAPTSAEQKEEVLKELKAFISAEIGAFKHSVEECALQAVNNRCDDLKRECKTDTNSILDAKLQARIAEETPHEVERQVQGLFESFLNKQSSRIKAELKSESEKAHTHFQEISEKSQLDLIAKADRHIQDTALNLTRQAKRQVQEEGDKQEERLKTLASSWFSELTSLAESSKQKVVQAYEALVQNPVKTLGSLAATPFRRSSDSSQRLLSNPQVCENGEDQLSPEPLSDNTRHDSPKSVVIEANSCESGQLDLDLSVSTESDNDVNEGMDKILVVSPHGSGPNRGQSRLTLVNATKQRDKNRQEATKEKADSASQADNSPSLPSRSDKQNQKRPQDVESDLGSNSPPGKRARRSTCVTPPVSKASSKAKPSRVETPRRTGRSRRKSNIGSGLDIRSPQAAKRQERAVESVSTPTRPKPPVGEIHIQSSKKDCVSPLKIELSAFTKAKAKKSRPRCSMVAIRKSRRKHPVAKTPKRTGDCHKRKRYGTYSKPRPSLELEDTDSSLSFSADANVK